MSFWPALDAVRLALQPSVALLTGPRDAHWPALADLQQLAADLNPSEAPAPTVPDVRSAGTSLAAGRTPGLVPASISSRLSPGGETGMRSLPPTPEPTVPVGREAAGR